MRRWRGASAESSLENATDYTVDLTLDRRCWERRRPSEAAGSCLKAAPIRATEALYFERGEPVGDTRLEELGFGDDGWVVGACLVRSFDAWSVRLRAVHRR